MLGDKGTSSRILGEVLGAERHFLAGRQSNERNLESAIRFFLEFLKGFESFQDLGPCVTVFGSARFTEDHRYYQLARDLGKALAEEGYAVLTGGGPGIMEAANRGAKEAGGRSFGCNIKLPKEQNANPYVDAFIEFEHFFIRKVMLVKYSSAFAVMPGGFGTLDEIFEVVTLIQTGKVDGFPIVALGGEFWDHMASFVEKTMINERTISREDLELIARVDTVEDALAHIRQGSRGHSSVD